MSSIACYYHTIKYLKLRQIYYRLWYRFKRIDFNLNIDSSLRTPAQNFIAPIVKPRQIYYQTATFLNKSVDIASSNIWNDLNQDRLWLYNLHYFNDLQCHTDAQHHVFLQNLIQRWTQENPPLDGCGWEPYPLSLRIVNWIKWHLQGNPLPEKIQTHLAMQAQVLFQKIEWHLLGNHLLANAKACLFAGLFFQTKHANQWLQFGIKLINQQLKEQILKDGGHFERTPMYHAIIVEDLLDIINLFTTYQQTIPDRWIKQVEQMLSWLKIMVHPDQEFSFFNDSALNIAPTLAELAAYALRLSIKIPVQPIQSIYHLADSGYCRLQNLTATLLCDIGAIGPDYLPGHAHADTLSFELSLEQQRVFVNSGISTYEHCAERLRQRGTAAHNTAVINGQNSSQVWAAFRVAKRARVKNLTIQTDHQDLQLTASHNGYRHLPEKIIHQRSWQLQKQQCSIKDYFIGRTKAEIFIYYHLHPRYLFMNKNDQDILIIDKKLNQTIAILSTDGQFQIIDSSYHPEFGVSIDNQCLQLGGLVTLPNSLNLRITWN